MGSGVPQDSVIAPQLFNAYVADIPDTVYAAPSADDITIIELSSSAPAAATAVSDHAAAVVSWAGDKELFIFKEKTYPTLFNSDSHQSHMGHLITLRNAPFTQE